jgi:hypothetical protein
VLIEYLLSATDISPTEVEEHVRHLPGGVETVKTTAEVLREEGYGLGVEKGKIENTRNYSGPPPFGQDLGSGY